MCAPSHDGPAGTIRIGRWANDRVPRPFEMIAGHTEEAHTISYCLRQQQIHLTSGVNVVIPALLLAGNMLLQAPTSAVRRAMFRGPYNTLHIYLPPNLIAQSYEQATGKSAPRDLKLFDPHVTNDPVLRDLVQTLIAADSGDFRIDREFVDGIGIALASRLVALALIREQPIDRPSPSLPKWRLAKVVAFLEENLGAQIYLDDLSAVEGLNRTHFVSRFNRATGCSSHAFHLQRRIEVAQNRLQHEKNPIADTALDLGFCNQSHSATVFKETRGVAPGRWRASQTGDSPNPRNRTTARSAAPATELASLGAARSTYRAYTPLVAK